MSIATEQDQKPDPLDILHVRPMDLKPLVRKYLARNPNKTATDLLREGIKLATRRYAGKKLLHLCN